ncbi:MAG: hypothetical protein ACFBWO_17150 [Paracoccaceae bacterium]
MIKIARRLAAVSAVTCLLASPALAAPCGPAATLAFEAGGDVDRFEIGNASTDGWSIDGVEITLGGTAEALAFAERMDDAETRSAYVMVPPPEDAETRTTEGAAELAQSPLMGEEEDRLAFAFERFAPGQRFVFTVDVVKDVAGVGPPLEDAAMDGAAVSVVFRSAGDEVAQAGARFEGGEARAETACEG